MGTRRRSCATVPRQDTGFTWFHVDERPARTSRRSIVAPIWDFNLGVAPRRRGVDRRHHALHLAPEYWPTRLTKHDDGDAAMRKILLVANVLVGRQQHVEAIRFSSIQS